MTGSWLSPEITELERAAAAHWQAADTEWLGSYERCGFQVAHSYHYRVAGPG